MRSLKNVTLELTTKCNFKCLHCSNDSGLKKNDDLTNKEILDLIDQLRLLKVERLSITGGEPFCDANLFKYLNYAKDKVKEITIATNGYLVNKDVVTKLKEINIKKISVSLDGTSAYHDFFRGTDGAFKKAIKTINLLTKEGFKVKVKSVLTKDNANSLLELISITNLLDIERHEIMPICPIGRADKEIMINAMQYKSFLIKALNKIKLLNKPNITFQLKPVFYQESLFKGVDERCLLKSLNYRCDAFDTSMQIGTNGDVYGCSFVRIPITNIRKKGIEEIWHSKEALNLRNKIMNHYQEGECLECLDNEKCHGGCYANKLYGNGIDKKDVYCFVKRRR